MLYLSLKLKTLSPPWLVYRVHWLRAFARAERWKEEMTLTAHEMTWTLASFGHRADRWKAYSSSSKIAGKFGHQYYANRQESFWRGMAVSATQSFQRAVAAAGGDPKTVLPSRPTFDPTVDEPNIVQPVQSETGSPPPGVESVGA